MAGVDARHFVVRHSTQKCDLLRQTELCDAGGYSLNVFVRNDGAGMRDRQVHSIALLGADEAEGLDYGMQSAALIDKPRIQ